MRPDAIIAFVLYLLCGPVAAQKQLCEDDGTLEGYKTLQAINNDMQVELQRISAGGQPEEAYEFLLCPETVFDASSDTLEPVLSGSTFICGSDGDPEDNCIILGGDEQVRIVDSTLPSFPLSQLNFIGLTFAGFQTNDSETGTSIAAFASSTTTASFIDTTWTVSPEMIFLSLSSELLTYLITFLPGLCKRLRSSTAIG